MGLAFFYVVWKWLYQVFIRSVFVTTAPDNFCIIEADRIFLLPPFLWLNLVINFRVKNRRVVNASLPCDYSTVEEGEGH